MQNTEERTSVVASPEAALSRRTLWISWTLSIIPVLMLIMSAVMKFARPPQVMEGFTHLGWPANLAVPLGILELACTVIYVVPRTSVLGAILLTGYLGGATATHVRVGESFVTPVILGVVIWAGLYLREPRLRQIAPFRQ